MYSIQRFIGFILILISYGYTEEKDAPYELSVGATVQLANDYGWSRGWGSIDNHNIDYSLDASGSFGPGIMLNGLYDFKKWGQTEIEVHMSYSLKNEGLFLTVRTESKIEASAFFLNIAPTYGYFLWGKWRLGVRPYLTYWNFSVTEADGYSEFSGGTMFVLGSLPTKPGFQFELASDFLGDTRSFQGRLGYGWNPITVSLKIHLFKTVIDNSEGLCSDLGEVKECFKVMTYTPLSLAIDYVF